MEKPPLQRNYGYSAKPPPTLNVNDLNTSQEFYKKYSRSVNTRGNVQLTQNVYLIEGHGEDILNDTFKVPEFSLVVVKLHTGLTAREINYIKDTDTLCKLGNTVLENPIKYAPKIINTVGTIAIYKPGDLCPNFRYTLLANYTSTEHDTLVKPNSGIFNFKMHCMNPIHSQQSYKELTKNCKTVKDIINVIKQFYKNSIYPTEDTIQKVIESMLPIMEIELDTIIDDPADLLNVFLDNLEDAPNSPIIVTQKELCENLPGVYYNFICRANEAYGKINNRFNSIIGIANRNVKNTLKKRIGESEIHRKQYIYRAYKSSIIKRIKNLEDEVIQLSNKKNLIEKELVELKNVRNAFKNGGSKKNHKRKHT